MDHRLPWRHRWSYFWPRQPLGHHLCFMKSCLLIGWARSLCRPCLRMFGPRWGPLLKLCWVCNLNYDFFLLPNCLQYISLLHLDSNVVCTHNCSLFGDNLNLLLSGFEPKVFYSTSQIYHSCKGFRSEEMDLKIFACKDACIYIKLVKLVFMYHDLNTLSLYVKLFE